MIIDDIASMLADDDRNPRNDLLKQLGKNSEILGYQLTDFKNMIGDRKIVSFYEREQSKRLEKVRNELAFHGQVSSRYG